MKRRTVVGPDGEVRLSQVDLPEGAAVEVIVLLEEAVDASALRLEDLTHGGLTLRPVREVVLQPEFDEEDGLYWLRHEPWSLEVFAATRAGLLEELAGQLAMLWREYAMEEDSVLSTPAIAVKQALLNDLTEV